MTTRSVPRLLAITDRSRLGARPLESWLAELAEAGVDTVQLREKDLDDRDLLALARRVREAWPGRLLINARADVAIAVGAEGIHLPAAGLPAAALRRRFGDALVVGVSTHHPGEVAAARDAGADYVTFGPVFPTPSKESWGAPPGVAGLRLAAGHGLPVIALGGLDAERSTEVAAAGAAGAAGIRVFYDAAGLRRLTAAWSPMA